MKLVVDVPEKKLKSLKRYLEKGYTLGMTEIEILNGKPLIVCKDCIHYDAKTHWCFTKCINIGPDGYCSDALKKEDN